MDDFGVTYFSEADTNHLIQALKIVFEITTDKQCSIFCGLHLDWDYKNKWVDISMHNYVMKYLKKLEHSVPNKPQYAPYG